MYVLRFRFWGLSVGCFDGGTVPLCRTEVAILHIRIPYVDEIGLHSSVDEEFGDVCLESEKSDNRSELRNKDVGEDKGGTRIDKTVIPIIE